MNTVLAPVTWELLEPAEGEFDFGQVDMMLELARERGLHLGVLWFGAYKNAQCYYAPAWVKRDIERFRRAQMVPGQNKVRYAEFHNFEITALSLYCEETRAADAGAYAALMAHLREVDAQDHTVILVQVENECGQMVAALVRGNRFLASMPRRCLPPTTWLATWRRSPQRAAPSIRCPRPAIAGSTRVTSLGAFPRAVPTCA